MPKTTLYFLRSSEQKITTDMLYYVMQLDKTDKSLKDFPSLDIYTKHYGLSSKDLGLYALLGHTIAGAVWLRQLKAEDGADAFVDAKTPILMLAVKPEFRKQGIALEMMKQLLLEAGAVFEQISLSVEASSFQVAFFEKLGFSKLREQNNRIVMLKKLQRQEVVRPTDGYDPRKWMD